MDAVRNFTNANRSSIMNAVYLVAFLVVIYYVYKIFVAGSELELPLTSGAQPANQPNGGFVPPNIATGTGGEYTISFWMYISNWDYRSGQAKSVLQIVDNKNKDKFNLLTTILYPNEPKMMVRVHTVESGQGTGEVDYTMVTNESSLLNGSGSAGLFTPNITMPVCDIQDIDLQRWIHVAISVNGRIVDVYYDGKLNRSCVLQDLPYIPDGANVFVRWGNNGGFGGSISNVVYYGYSLTPARIYAIYQNGPNVSSLASGLLGYLGDLLGIRLTYSGIGGMKRSL